MPPQDLLVACTLPVGASTVTSLPESLESSQKEGNKSYSQDFKGSLRVLLAPPWEHWEYGLTAEEESGEVTSRGVDGEKRERKLIEKYIVSAGKPDRVIGHQATRTKGAESMNRISDGRCQ